MAGNAPLGAYTLMTQRAYSRDIGRVSFILGCLMILAALAAMSMGSLMPSDDPAFSSRLKNDWVFAHPLLAVLLQLSLGTSLAVTAAAFLRGRDWGRPALRAALAIVAVAFLVFSIMWVPTIGAVAAEITGRGWPRPVFFALFAAAVSLSWLVPMIMAVRYLGTLRGRLDRPSAPE